MSSNEPELYYERRILKLLTQRILGIGYPQYGEMSCNMELDHIQESLEEIADALVYIAIQMMKLQGKRDEAEKVSNSGNEQKQLQQSKDNNKESSCTHRTCTCTGQ